MRPGGDASSLVAEDLRRRLAELAGINAIGLALGSTRDPGALLDAGLGEIVGRLGFGRGLLALVDEAAGTIGDFRVAGTAPGMGFLLAELAVPIDDPVASLAVLVRADGPLRFRDVLATGHDADRRIAAALGLPSWVGTPLVTQGRAVGVLLVDDHRDGADLEPADGPLLYTVGTLFAGAIESARLNAELEAQNRLLEARVAERTRDLLEAMTEAQEARAAAESASEAKSRFLSNVSHELRTPLTSIVGFAKLNRRRLEETVFPLVPQDDPKVARAVRQVGETLGIVVDEGDRLTGLINDLLDLAKIEAGRLEWRMEPLDTEAMVRQALAATTALFEVSGLELEVDATPGLPAVTGDRNRLVQVVINLVSNAVKFTPAGRIVVAIGPHGDGVQVGVTDSGRGIPEGDLERIFQPFRQSSDTVPDGPKGTGLGLPISKQIVEAHGGTMGVESVLGAGSTFWFTLPGGDAAAAGGETPGGDVALDREGAPGSTGPAPG